MKTLSGNYFIVGVRYQKMLEDGAEVKTTEQYVVEALSWTESESTTTNNMAAYNHGDMDIVTMKKANFSELFLSERDDEDKYYECSINIISVDEKSSKEKRSKVRYLVQGKSFENAKKNLDEAMSGTMLDYEVAGLKETSIIDIFLYEKKEAS